MWPPPMRRDRGRRVGGILPKKPHVQHLNLFPRRSGQLLNAQKWLDIKETAGIESGEADVARGLIAKECVSRNAADLDQVWEITVCVLNVAVNF